MHKTRSVPAGKPLFHSEEGMTFFKRGMGKDEREGLPFVLTQIKTRGTRKAIFQPYGSLSTLHKYKMPLHATFPSERE